MLVGSYHTESWDTVLDFLGAKRKKVADGSLEEF